LVDNRRHATQTAYPVSARAAPVVRSGCAAASGTQAAQIEQCYGGRAGISRSTLYKVETGDAGATLGSYMRVLVVMGLEGDLNLLAADDRLGRKLQDLALEPKRRTHRHTPSPSESP